MQCPNCRAEAVAGAEFCPHCGASLGTVAAGPTVVYPATSGLSDNAAGAIAYLTFIPAVIFLVLEPYNRSLFVRFHAYQCIALTVVSIITQIIIRVLLVVFHFVPVLGALLVGLISLVVGLILFIVWLIAIIKASQGVMYKVPVIGDYAEKLATGGSL